MEQARATGQQPRPLRKSRYNPLGALGNRPRSCSVFSSWAHASFHNRAQQHLSQHRGYRSLSFKNAGGSKRSWEAPNVPFVLSQCSYTRAKKVGECNFDHEPDNFGMRKKKKRKEPYKTQLRKPIFGFQQFLQSLEDGLFGRQLLFTTIDFQVFSKHLKLASCHFDWCLQ